MLNLVVLFLVCSLKIEVHSQNVTTTTAATQATSPPATPKCGIFPRALNPNGDCCFVPNHLDSDLHKNCTKSIYKKYEGKENNKVLREIEDCYTKVTGIFVGVEFKKNAVRQIYEENTKQQEKHLGFNPWLPIVDEALKLCELSNGKLKDYYKCMTNNLIDKCPWSAISSSDSCDEVDNFFEKCAEGDTASYCKAWPIKLVMPESCCDHPEIISSVMAAECSEECSTKPTHMERAACSYECCYKKASVKQGGKFDFDAVKKVLLANSNKTSSWEKSIDKAVDACKPLVEAVESSQTDVQANNFIRQCLRENLGNHCVEFKSDLSCQRVKRFMEKCAGVLPKRPEVVTKEPETTLPMTDEHTTVAEEATTSALDQGSTVAEEAHTTVETAAESGS